ncbi:hypothetical protein [Streptomyces sp. NPDC002088]|uniref:hypothetical protein n=1 Tax=unclassified Streptomyces TaxID=2593676 RepID=UPI003332D24D
MADQRPEERGESGPPVPRDLPDQQAREGEDPWEASPEGAQAEQPDVPDTDEAGTGRRGEPQSANVHPEHPTPDEPTD